MKKGCKLICINNMEFANNNGGYIERRYDSITVDESYVAQFDSVKSRYDFCQMVAIINDEGGIEHFPCDWFEIDYPQIRKDKIKGLI